MTARIISQFACCLESGATGAAVESLRTPIQIRMAVPTDIAALHALIEASVRGLMPQGYTSDQLEGALGTLLGVDTQLIADGTYFVAEAVLNDNSMLVGCGGWSKRKTLFGSDHRRGREDELLIRTKMRQRFAPSSSTRNGR